jgi:hypothetical protein
MGFERADLKKRLDALAAKEVFVGTSSAKYPSYANEQSAALGIEEARDRFQRVQPFLLVVLLSPHIPLESALKFDCSGFSHSERFLQRDVFALDDYD